MAAVRKFALSKEEADSPRAHSFCYFRQSYKSSSPSSHHGSIFVSRSNPPPPSLSKNFAHNPTLFVYIFFLSYRHARVLQTIPLDNHHLRLVGDQPVPPLLQFHSVTDRAEESHFRPPRFRGNPSKLRTLARYAMERRSRYYLFLFFFKGRLYL